MVRRGRRKLVPPAEKQIEKLTDGEYAFLDRMIGGGIVAMGLPVAWMQVQAARLDLAQVHLEAARSLNTGGKKGAIDQQKRSVVSRAYYSMYCAARAALSYHENGDREDHKKLPTWIANSNLGGQEERERVVSALNKYRNLRNEADYSPFYPTPLGAASKLALREAEAILRICRRWFKLTKQARGVRP